MEEIILHNPDWRTLSDDTRSIVGPGIVTLDELGRVVCVRALIDSREPQQVAAVALPEKQETVQAEQSVNGTPIVSTGG